MNLVAAAMSALALHAAPFTPSIAASGHTPKIGAKWAYSIKIVDTAGKPVAAKISIVVVDPIGRLHPVRRYRTGTAVGPAVTNLRIGGRFADAIAWPPEARGYPLVLRAIVTAGGTRRTVTYRLTPK